MASDSFLVDEVHEGATSRFEELLRRHNPLVFRTARAVLRNDADAEECAQRAWVAAFEHLSQYDGSGPFPAWIGRIAFREALKMRRAHAKSRPGPAAGEHRRGPRQPEERVAVESSAHDALERAEARAVLEAAIDALPPSLRPVFVLRDVEELSGDEAAAALGISPANVRVRLHRARQLLRARLTSSFGSAAAAFSFAGERCDRIVLGVLARCRPDPKNGHI